MIFLSLSGKPSPCCFCPGKLFSHFDFRHPDEPMNRVPLGSRRNCGFGRKVRGLFLFIYLPVGIKGGGSACARTNPLLPPRSLSLASLAEKNGFLSLLFKDIEGHKRAEEGKKPAWRTALPSPTLGVEPARDDDQFISITLGASPPS